MLLAVHSSIRVIQSLIYTGLESQNWKRPSPLQIQSSFLIIIFWVKTGTLPQFPPKKLTLRKTSLKTRRRRSSKSHPEPLCPAWVRHAARSAPRHARSAPRPLRADVPERMKTTTGCSPLTAAAAAHPWGSYLGTRSVELHTEPSPSPWALMQTKSELFCFSSFQVKACSVPHLY